MFAYLKKIGGNKLFQAIPGSRDINNLLLGKKNSAPTIVPSSASPAVHLLTPASSVFRTSSHLPLDLIAMSRPLNPLCFPVTQQLPLASLPALLSPIAWRILCPPLASTLNSLHRSSRCIQYLTPTLDATICLLRSCTYCFRNSASVGTGPTHAVLPRMCLWRYLVIFYWSLATPFSHHPQRRSSTLPFSVYRRPSFLLPVSKWKLSRVTFLNSSYISISKPVTFCAHFYFFPTSPRG